MHYHEQQTCGWGEVLQQVCVNFWCLSLLVVRRICCEAFFCFEYIAVIYKLITTQTLIICVQAWLLFI